MLSSFEPRCTMADFEKKETGPKKVTLPKKCTDNKKLTIYKENHETNKRE